MAHILIVDDDRNILTTMSITLKRENHEVVCAETFSDAENAITKTIFDIVITDLRLANGKSGIDVLKTCKTTSPETHVVVITAFSSVESAIEAMQEGASDYIIKPCGPDQLVFSINRVLEKSKLLSQIDSLKKEVESHQPSEEIIGKSKCMQKVLQTLPPVAGTDSTVLITGETGTGKDLIAKAIHKKSRRKDQPFMVINCAVLPENLLESELFGHVKGAFSGAVTNKKGLILEADGGTLFLDEIGDMPIALQAKLLRFIEQGEVRAVGSNKNFYVNVRLIAATNRDLQKAVNEKTFRADLYYRMKVVKIHLPPLRERGGDALLLAGKFLQRFAQQMNKPDLGFSKEAREVIKNYQWPGNVRELKHAIEGAVIITNGEAILPEHLDLPTDSFTIKKSDQPPQSLALYDVSRQHVLDVLEKCNWNQKRATEILKISKATLWRKLKEYDIDIKALRQSTYS